MRNYTLFPFLLIRTVHAWFYNQTYPDHDADHVGVVAGGIYVGQSGTEPA